MGSHQSQQGFGDSCFSTGSRRQLKAYNKTSFASQPTAPATQQMGYRSGYHKTAISSSYKVPQIQQQRDPQNTIQNQKKIPEKHTQMKSLGDTGDTSLGLISDVKYDIDFQIRRIQSQFYAEKKQYPFKHSVSGRNQSHCNGENVQTFGSHSYSNGSQFRRINTHSQFTFFQNNAQKNNNQNKNLKEAHNIFKQKQQQQFQQDPFRNVGEDRRRNLKLQIKLNRDKGTN